MIDLKGKKVVVVGGAGFVGMSLVHSLIHLGAKVAVLDNYSRDKLKTRRVKGAGYAPGRVGDDASHLATCKAYFRDAFAVFNLAAHVGGIHYNLNHQLEMLHENTLLQLVPVVAAEQEKVPYFLQTSSVCVYSPEHQTGEPVKEEVGLLGKAQAANYGYALAKRLGEEAALMSQIPNVVVVRPSNVAGPGDYYDEKAHVVPALVKRVATAEKVDVYSSPNVVREFVHPVDVAAGMIYALTAGKSRETYNVGNPGNVISIGGVVNLILELGEIDKEVVYHSDSESGDERRCSDSSKLMALGYQPKHDMRSIIQSEIDGLPPAYVGNEFAKNVVDA